MINGNIKESSFTRGICKIVTLKFQQLYHRCDHIRQKLENNSPKLLHFIPARVPKMWSSHIISLV